MFRASGPSSPRTVIVNHRQTTWIPTPTAFNPKNTAYDHSRRPCERCRNVQNRLPRKATTVAQTGAQRLPHQLWEVEGIPEQVGGEQLRHVGQRADHTELGQLVDELGETLVHRREQSHEPFRSEPKGLLDFFGFPRRLSGAAPQYP